MSTISSQLYEYPPLPSASHIRLLRIMPDDGGDLVLNIRTIPIEEAKNGYFAFSYAWGDTAMNHTVFIIAHEGHRFRLSVTKALVSLLSDIRNSDKLTGCACWIDGICLNQANRGEIQQQIPRMADIYKSAVCVITYVGPSMPDIDLAVSHMETLLRLNEDRPLDFIREPEFSVFEEHFEDLGLPAASLPGWDALGFLLNLPWSNRLWIVQESLTNENMLMMCGSRMIDWHAVAVTAVLASRGRLPRRTILNPHPEMKPSLDRNALCLVAISDMRAAFRLKTNLLKTAGERFDAFRRFQCTDPRDRIFALLPVVTEHYELSQLLNYSESVGSIYINTAVRVIQRDNTLQILTYVGFPTNIHLPTWVPDWSMEPEDIRLSDTLYAASAGTISRATFSHDCAKITFNGYLVDDIQHIWQPVDLLELIDSRNNFLVVSTLAQLLLVLKRYARHSESDSAFDALWRTLIADRASVDDAIQRAGSAQKFAFVLFLGFMARQAPKYAARRRTLLIKYASYIGLSKTMLRGRAIGVTKTGYLSLIPVHARVGDVICVACGASTPFLIRSIEDEYEFLGQAYVHGIMDGEIVEQADRPLRKITLK